MSVIRKYCMFLGRVVAKGIGGGIKHKYHWIDWLRDGSTEGPPQEEKVIQVFIIFIIF